MAETRCCLKYAWVGKAYHSTHTSYLRGVSVMIHNSVDFQEFDVCVDDEGRYVFLHCRVGKLNCILACVYVPPPFTAAVLRLLLTYLEGRPDLPLLIVEDFNCWLSPSVDRHPSLGAPVTRRDSPLLRLLNEVGWVDIWRLKNPNERQFSCFSKTHGTLSRIDLAVGNLAVLPSVSEVLYKPRSVSDHSHLVISLIISPKPGLPRVPWKFNAFWLKLFLTHGEMERSMGEFLNAREFLQSPMEQWDAFKAYMRGLLISEIGKVKKNSSEHKEELERQVGALEESYVRTPTDSAREAWQSAKSAYERLLSSTAEKKLYFSRLAFYEEGKSTGRLLARIANS